MKNDIDKKNEYMKNINTNDASQFTNKTRQKALEALKKAKAMECASKHKVVRVDARTWVYRKEKNDE
jgi:hypothetical protein